jgi:hypothetical protein
MIGERTDPATTPPQAIPSSIPSLAFVIAGFLLSRLVAHIAGVPFESASLAFYWHFVDPALLRDRLVESLFFLHGQPPLLNLYTGLILKLFPGREEPAFYITFLFLGLCLTIALYFLMTRLGVHAWWSVGLTLLFVTSPACILFENWLFYTYPLLVFLCLAALFLHRFLSSARLCEALLFFTFLAFVVLLRSTFHLLWFVLLALLLLFFQRRYWKKILLSAFVPFLILLVVYVKNLILFGSLVSSTWMGMNLARMTVTWLPEETRQVLVEEGKLSQLAMIQPFSDLHAYPEAFRTTPETGVAILDLAEKTTGATNLYHNAYIELSKQYHRDSLYVLTHHPEAYRSAIRTAYFLFFLPANNYFPMLEGREQIRHWDQFHSQVISGQLRPLYEGPLMRTFTHRYEQQEPLNLALFVIASYAAAIAFGSCVFWKVLRGRSSEEPFTLTVLFLWFNILYVTLISNAFEVGENNRFRFVVDPSILVLVGVVLSRILAKALQTQACRIDPSGGPSGRRRSI